MKRKRDRIHVLRLGIQAAFVAFILVAAVRHNTSAVETPSTHAYCPFGIVASIGPLLETGNLAPKLHLSTAVLGVGVLVGAILAGGAFCGWVCPFGTLQDALNWVRAKLHIREVTVPARVDRFLRYGRYVLLLGIVYATWATAKLWFADYDPYYTLFSLSWLFEFNLAAHWPAYLIVVSIVAGSLFIPRLWCRYLCPLGGLLSLLQRISPIKVRRNAQVCIDCKRCDRVCPARLQVSTGQAVTHDCSMCLRCTSSCPVPGALELRLPQAKGTSATPKEVKPA